MPYFVLAIIIVLAGVIIAFLRGRSAYYGKIFSDNHYAEIGNWLVTVLKRGPVEEANVDDGTAFQSSAGCGLTFTREIGERDRIHIAISQVGNPTTHAVCDRLGFLILQILNQNHAEADFYYTESTIHHMVFAKDTGGEWLTRDVDAVVSEMNVDQPLPFRFQPTGGPQKDQGG